MTPDFAIKLGLIIQKTNVSAQKIDSSALEIYDMVIAKFLFQDKLKKPSFFEKTFLLADTSMDVILEILFLTINNANVNFPGRKLRWQSYSTSNALPIAQKVELINKKKFARSALNENAGTFVVYIAALEAIEMTIHPF